MKKILILLIFLISVSLQGQIRSGVIAATAVASGGGDGELLNGNNFSSSDCWAVSADFSISSNVLNYAGAAASTCVQLVCGTANIDVTIYEDDTDYRLEFDVVSDAPGIYVSVWTVNAGGTLTDGLVGGANKTTGRITIDFSTTTLGANGFCLRAWGDAAGTIDNISLKKR